MAQPYVMTVEGEVDVESLGVVLTHEHVFVDIDWPGLWPDVAGGSRVLDEPVSITNLGEIRRDYMAVRDNARLDQPDVAIRELSYFKDAGGGAIVEMTGNGLGGRPAELPAVAAGSGVRIIAATGRYLATSLEPEALEESIGTMTRGFIRDIESGFPGTDVRAGHIGEIALSSPMHPAEERALRAAARAQKETGVSVSVHIGMDPDLIATAIAILKDEAADLERFGFDHVDSPGPAEPYLPMLDLGIRASFDTFGHEFYCDNGAYDGPWPWYFPQDGERALGVTALIERGYADQVLLSHDICVKMQLREYGGWGYGHVLQHVAPMLERMGVSATTIEGILVRNPVRFLAVTA